MFNVSADVVVLSSELAHALHCFQQVSVKAMVRKALILQVKAVLYLLWDTCCCT